MMNFTPVIDFITKYDKFILCGHESPDGDAIGSAYALLRVLKNLKKEAYIFNSDPAPENFTFIDKDYEIGYIEDPTVLPENLPEFVLIILDTNDIHNIGSVQKWVLPRVKDFMIIDHHDCDEIIDGNLIYRDASSTAEILYQLFKAMKVKIDLPIARALFMAIVYDTGSFIYPKTTAKTFEIAHALVKLGVNPNTTYSRMYETNSIPSILLHARVLATLEFYLNNHVAVQTMLKNTIIETGAAYEEGRSFINTPLSAQNIKVSIFFKESQTGALRCSIRSKDGIDVGRIARDFGGGGHRTAAGFRCNEDIEATKQIILEKLKDYFNESEKPETEGADPS